MILKDLIKLVLDNKDSMHYIEDILQLKHGLYASSELKECEDSKQQQQHENIAWDCIDKLGELADLIGVIELTSDNAKIYNKFTEIIEELKKIEATK
jgi:hypothetical protein